MNPFFFFFNEWSFNSQKITCFLSYIHTDADFVRKTVLPILTENNIDVWSAATDISLGGSIFDNTRRAIRESDILIYIYNKNASFINFEFGLAIESNKPILMLIDDIYLNEISNKLDFTYILHYNENEINSLQSQLALKIHNILEHVIYKSTFQQYISDERNKIIGISVGSEFDDFELELRFTLSFIDFIKEFTFQPNISLIQSSKGSLKSLISIDLKSWAELLEKLIFFNS